MAPLFGFLPSIGMQEMLLLLVVGVLLFGRKLPEVGRYLGKGIVEFKKGIRGIEDDVDVSTTASTPAQAEAPKPPQKIASTVPKFEDIIGNPESTTPKV